MKCMYGQRKRALPSDVRAAAIQVAHEIMAQQCEQVVRRSWNEMLVAMHQAGLSPRTIRRVTEKLDAVVLPYVDDLRNPDGGLKTPAMPSTSAMATSGCMSTWRGMASRVMRLWRWKRERDFNHPRRYCARLHVCGILRAGRLGWKGCHPEGTGGQHRHGTQAWR